MGKYYFAFLFLYSFHVYATDPLGKLIQGLDGVGSINCEEMTDEELSEQCLRNVCGPPGNKASDITVKNTSKFLTPSQLTELKNVEIQVGKIFKKRKKETQDFISELKNRFKDPHFKKTANWDNYDFSYYSNFFWDYIDWQIDVTKPINKRSKINIDESRIDPVLLPGIKEFADQFNNNLYNDPLYSFEMGITNIEELKTALIKKSKEAELKLEEKKINYNFKEHQQLINQSNQPEQIIQKFKELEEIAKSNDITLIANNDNCQTQCKKAITHFVKEMDTEDIISNLQNTLDYADEKDQIAECKVNFIAANQRNVLEENFKKIWPEVKEGFHKNVLPHFSAHSQAIMKDYLDNGIHFYFENPTDETFPNISEMLKDIKSSPLKEKSNGFILGDLMKNHFDKDISLYRSDIQICNPSTTPNLIWDNYMSKQAMAASPTYQRPHHNLKKDNISVSPFTCEHNNEGAGILAHELGHAFSSLMNNPEMSSSSLKEYLTIRSCASAQWDTQDAAQYQYHVNDKQFTEEDAADIISYMAINNGNSIYACGFIGVNVDETSYKDYSPDPWGVHSPSFIRLMRELSYKRTNSIPKTCSTLMNKNQDKLGDKKCF